MLVGTRHRSEAEMPLGNAVLCLDCEVISHSCGGECPACKSHALLSLARVLGGSLREGKSHPGIQSGSFDITLTIQLQQVYAKDVNTTLESLTNVIGPRLAQGRASFHINVQTTADNSFHRAA